MLRNLIISRTDSLGDVILTLPAAGLMKKLIPGIKIYFLGRSYTQPIIQTCSFIDEFINWDEVSGYAEEQKILFFKSLNCDAIVHVFPDFEIARLAFQSKIPLRIGTSHRYYHWLYCNKVVPLGRKKSDLHETQLNIKLFQSLGANDNIKLNEISTLYGLNQVLPLEKRLLDLIDLNRFNIILHPKSKGSAREWGLENFGKLITLLPKDNYKIFVTGTNEDRKFLLPLLNQYQPVITDLTGQMSLTGLISFIAASDGLIAASTGPLHIAAALKKVTIGLYAPMRPIHPGRWAPLGEKATYIVIDKNCRKCRKSTTCECILKISPAEVLQRLQLVRNQTLS
jgi:ADP-heptose:LPS heptosyltransferase